MAMCCLVRRRVVTSYEWTTNAMFESSFDTLPVLIKSEREETVHFGTNKLSNRTRLLHSQSYKNLMAISEQWGPNHWEASESNRAVESLQCGGIAASNWGMISFAKFSNFAASGTYLKTGDIYAENRHDAGLRIWEFKKRNCHRCETFSTQNINKNKLQRARRLTC